MTEKLSRPKVAVSLTVFALAIGGMFVWYSGELPTSSFPAVNLTSEQRNLLALVTYVNAQGQEWSIPTGEYAFSVSSNPKLYPRFLSGDIDPLDVKVGDTQRMKIVVVDVAEPKRVWAEIEHDAGKDTVELTLTGTKALVREELEKRPYLVDESGKLILNDASQKFSVKSIVDRLVSRAEAEGEAEYTYEGSWVVHDTHTKTYRTTFVAESAVGRKENFVMAWSDPVCEFSLDVQGRGVLQDSCSPSSGIEGFDGNSVLLQNFSINLGSGAKFVFNSGTSIDLSSGAKFGDAQNPIQGGAAIEEGYIYYGDQDGDGYANNVQRYVFSSPGTGDRYQNGASWYTRAKAVRNSATQLSQNIVTTDLDCWDNNPNAKFGQTQYYATHRGDGSFDYDCDGLAPSYANGDKAGRAEFGSIINPGTMVYAGPPTALCEGFPVDDTVSGPAGSCGQDWWTPNGYCNPAGTFKQEEPSFFARVLEKLFGYKTEAAIKGVGFYSNNSCNACLGRVTAVCR